MGTLLNRRRYMGGKPSAQMVDIEYLQSDGNQWIELGIYGSNDLDFTIDFEPLDLTETNRTWTGTGAYFGAVGASGDRKYALVGYNRNESRKGCFFWNGNTEAAGYTVQVGLLSQRVTVSKSGGSITRPDGTTASMTGYASWVNPTSQTLALFAYKVSGNVFGRPGKMKLYSIKFEKDDDTLLDLVPVRVGQVGCLYDKVSGKLFENETSTPFILGPDKIGG